MRTAPAVVVPELLRHIRRARSSGRGAGCVDGLGVIVDGERRSSWSPSGREGSRPGAVPAPAALDQLQQVATTERWPSTWRSSASRGGRAAGGGRGTAAADAAAAAGRRACRGRPRRAAELGAAARRDRPAASSQAQPARGSGADTAGPRPARAARQRRQRRRLAHQLVGHAQHRSPASARPRPG